MLNAAETQPGQKEGMNNRAGDAVKEDRNGIAPGHFLKAPSLCHTVYGFMFGCFN